MLCFGFQWFERFCAEHGTESLVLNNEQLSPEQEQELVQDLLTIVHCFSARLYGLRNYRIGAGYQQMTDENAALP